MDGSRTSTLSGEFKGKVLDTALLYRPSGLKCGKLLAIGGGKFSAFGSAELRKVAGAAVRVLKPKGSRTIAFALDPGFASPEHVAAAVEGALLGDFETDRYKTENQDERKTVDSFSVVLAEALPEHEQALARGRIVAGSQNFTRELVYEPGNRLSPSLLAGHATRMAA